MMPVIGIGTAIFFVCPSLPALSDIIATNAANPSTFGFFSLSSHSSLPPPQALQLIQTHLSHSRSLSDAQIRITHLESELAHLQSIQRRQAVSWGDSLGRVIKVVQEVAVGPKQAAVGPEGEAAVLEAGEAGKVGSKYVDQASSTGTTSVISPSTTTGTNASIPIDPGMDALVDRVKGEFGDESEAGSRTKTSRWSGWFGGKK